MPVQRVSGISGRFGVNVKGIGALPGSYPISVPVGGRVRLYQAQFNYTGPPQTLYICWGLKRREILGVTFSNGGGLQGGYFTSAPLLVPAGNNTPVSINVDASLLILSGTPEATYDVFVWVSKARSALESDMLVIDTDAGIVRVTSAPTGVANLEAGYQLA